MAVLDELPGVFAVVWGTELLRRLLRRRGVSAELERAVEGGRRRTEDSSHQSGTIALSDQYLPLSLLVSGHGGHDLPGLLSDGCEKSVERRTRYLDPCMGHE